MAESQDALWGGRLVVWQPSKKAGYRFNIDSVLLAGFVAERTGALGRVLDLGAGCGIVGLMLAAAGCARHVTAVERQPQLAALARRNVVANGLTERMEVLQEDLRTCDATGFDTVVFNPPYFERDRGVASPEPGRDAARREVHGTLADFVAVGARALGPGGRLHAIIPVHRDADFAAALVRAGLAVQRRVLVHPDSHTPARHLLIEAHPPRGDQATATSLQTLYVHERDRTRFTAPVAAWLAGSLGPAAGAPTSAPSAPRTPREPQDR